MNLSIRSTIRECIQTVWLQFAWLLAPLLVLLVASSVIRALFPANAAVAGAAYLAVLSLHFVFLPRWLLMIWRCETLHDVGLEKRIDQVFIESQMRAVPILVWRTGGRAVNALLVGVFRWQRSIVLTDSLLECFTHDEIAAVCRHEIGHVRHHHLLKRLGYFMLPLLIVVALAVAKPVWFTDAFEILTTWQGIPTVMSWLGIGLATLFYYVVVVGDALRQGEYEADLAACWSQSSSTIDPEYCRQYQSALKKLAVLMPRHYYRGGWIHPSIRQRIDQLQQIAASDDPARSRSRFRDKAQLRLTALAALGVMSIWLLMTISWLPF